MVQYFVPCIVNLSSNDVSIDAWMEPSDYLNGKTVDEHGVIGSNFVEAFEGLLIPNGYYYKGSVVWSCDKAEEEEGRDSNLFAMCYEGAHKICPELSDDLYLYPYLVNHSKKVYVDKRDSLDLHPLPLLTAQCTGVSLGDLVGTDAELVGSWCRDSISVEKTPSLGYQKIECCFES